MEPRARVELATCRLRIGCSTTELPRLGGEIYLSTCGKLLSILHEAVFPRHAAENIPSSKKHTWPSRSLCQTAEKAATTTQYTSRARAGGAGSGNQTQWISRARTAASLADGSNGKSSRSSFPAARGFVGV